MAHRLQLFRQTLHLIADFPLTGAGLGSFPGLYSQYILDIPYYMLPSSHNLLLDVALEQGLLGLLAFCMLLVGTLWLLLRAPAGDTQPAGPESTLRWAAIASLTVLLIHGIVDDPIYSSKALPLLFIAPGIAGFTHRAHTPRHPLTRSPFPALAILTTALALTLALLSPSWQAKWYSNLGALEMARVQLAEWPTGVWSEGSEAVYLDDAEAHFLRSLSLDPQNTTARHRMGLLAMMRRDYATAIHHLSIAHATAQAHDGIQKALGYGYLWSGQPEQALEHLQGLPGIRGELQAYTTWWKDQDRRDLARIAAAMLTIFQENSSAAEA